MGEWTVDRAAASLLAAQDARHEHARLTDGWPELDVATAYAVQDRCLHLRLVRGERVVGVKLGLTSRAKQERMHIDTPLTAWLTDAMVVPAGTPVVVGEHIQPRAEPEIAFELHRDLGGPGVSAVGALGAVGAVYGGIEVLDSRFAQYSFGLPDVVADNASSSGFVLGPVGRVPSDLNLALEGCLVEADGQVIDSATGAAIQGHPAEALAMAANSLAARGHVLKAGWIVLTGGMTDAVPLRAGGALRVSFANLGELVVAGV